LDDVQAGHKGRACLLREATGSNKFQGFHLAEMRGVAKHVDIHELGHIAVSVGDILLLKGVSQSSALFCNNITFLGRSLALPHAPDEFSASSNHSSPWVKRGPSRNIDFNRRIKKMTNVKWSCGDILFYK
jgi:hypothetical protein